MMCLYYCVILSDPELLSFVASAEFTFPGLRLKPIQTKWIKVDDEFG